MNHRSRRILSTLLLLLYGFIITPVTLWHSHACDSPTTMTWPETPASGKQVVKAGHSCLICEHAYAPYTTSDDSWEEVPATDYHQYYNPYGKVVPNLLMPRYNTRGSPGFLLFV